MPEYDAFGREIGEDTLSGLVSEPAAQPTPPQPRAPAPESWTPPPAPQPTPGAPQAAPDAWAAPKMPTGFGTPPPAEGKPPRGTFTIPGGIPTGRLPGSRRRRGGGGALIAFVILATVVALPVFVVVNVVNKATDAVDTFDALVPDPAEPGPDEPSTKPAKPPVGLAGASLIRPANLKKGLARMRAANLGRIVQLDVRPEVINAQLVKNGKLRQVRLQFDGALDKGTLAGGAINFRTIPYGAIDVRAPERLVRRAAKRYHRPVKRIDYVIASVFPGQPHHWAAYFEGGRIVEGDGRGHVVRLIS
jgi:hypothetical protein